MGEEKHNAAGKEADKLVKPTSLKKQTTPHG